MENKDKYIKQPIQKSKNILEKIFGVYKYLHPNYLKRKLINLIFVAPAVWMLYTLLISIIILSTHSTVRISDEAFMNIYNFLPLALTILSAFFYPFSLYWYKQSFIGRLLNNMVFIGSFWGVVQKLINVIIGGVLIAGFFSPITGYLLYRKCVRKNKIIGEAKDFEWG